MREDGFPEYAERFVAFVDSTAALTREEFIRQLEHQLLDLYRAALQLHTPEPSAEFEPLGSMTQEEWAALHQRLTDQLGDFNNYSFVFDPYDERAAPVIGSLADDVADIYRDLRNGLTALRSGHSLGDVAWEWRFGFENHWGRHAAHALYAVYVLTIDQLGGHS